MGVLSSVRRKRKHPAIEKGSREFKKCVQDKDYNGSANIVFWTVLQVSGSKGILSAIEDGNRFIKRRKLRGNL